MINDEWWNIDIEKINKWWSEGNDDDDQMTNIQCKVMIMANQY